MSSGLRDGLLLAVDHHQSSTRRGVARSATSARMADVERRMLKIKTGSVVRLKKELGLYETEKDSEVKRVATMKEQGADVHDIKHAVSVLEEAKIMIPDTRQRLEGALQDLTNYVANVEAQTNGLEELKAAKFAIDIAQAALT